jgi:hypothetical protein
MEARQILGQLRQAEMMHYYENEAYTSNLGALYVNAPTACTSTHYFSYTATGTSTDDGVGSALRCTTGGKTPDVDTTYTINLTWSGGEWGGTPGYY